MHDGPYRLLLLIAAAPFVQQAEEMARSLGVEDIHLMKGRGTATGEIKELFGLGSSDKTILAALTDAQTAGILLGTFGKRLYLGMPNTGIAFTVPVSGGSRRLFDYVDMNSVQGENGMEEDRNYTLVVAIVNQGCSDLVMEAARGAGARGGTVLHSRRLESGKAVRIFKISIQEERETVLILVRSSRRRDVMSAINSSCGPDSDCQGLVFSMPVASTQGLG